MKDRGKCILLITLEIVVQNNYEPLPQPFHPTGQSHKNETLKERWMVNVPCGHIDTCHLRVYCVVGTESSTGLQVLRGKIFM